MLRNKSGFSLVELIVVMAIFVIVIAITGEAFQQVVKQASQQSKTAESNIEGVLGLEIMRKDIASAGFGLPWSFSGTINYNEAVGAIAAGYNDAPTNVPRAICGGSVGDTPPTGYVAQSDYLVIKASNIGMSEAAQRWTYMDYTGVTKPPTVKPYTWPKENLENGNRVTVIRVGLTSVFTKELVVVGGSFFTQYNNDGLPDGFQPTESRIAHYIYGVDPSVDLRMPFNRADYFVQDPGAAERPARCAPNTGVLYKATVSHADGTLTTLPLLDCVADMQVVYLLDTTSNGTMTEIDDISDLSPQQIREQLKAVKVYILTHEGGKDRYYSYPNATIDVGPAGSGRNFNLSTGIGAEYKQYRWKVYFMTVKPENVNIATQ
ncbi:MAG: PilW family protein [Geobacteraceae bacterium]|nr:PilW family protein [Geobacteraceae bacterium]